MGIRKPFKLPGKPNWYVDVNRKRRSTGTADHREAMTIYRDLVRRYELHDDQARSESIASFVTDFLKYAKPLHSESTMKQARQSFTKLQNHVGVLDLKDVDQKAIDRLVSGLISEGLAKSSVNAYLRKLKAAFKKAVEWYGYPIVKIRLLKEDRRPPAVIPKEKVRQFLDQLTGSTRLLVESYLSSGRRRCELLNLTWEDVDLDNRRYFVNQRKVHLSQWFPIGQAFFNLLSGMPKGTGRIFPGLSPNYATRLVKQALCLCGLDNLRLHDLRHTYAALYLENGGDIYALKELLGHRQIQTTMIYAHLSPQHLAKEADRVTFA